MNSSRNSSSHATHSHPIRTIEPHEFDAWARMITTTYGQDWREGTLRDARGTIEPERTLAAYDGADIVGGVSIYGRTMTVPGGCTPVAGITLVAVLPTHRRRGILTAMMRRQLTDLHESGGEPIAALNAAEATIYGRYGYGVASHRAVVEADKRVMALRPDTDFGAGSLRLLDADAARPLLEKVYDAARQDVPGWVDRTEKYWNARLYDADAPHIRDGATALRYVVHTDPAGEVTGYAVYRSHRDTARIVELAATTRQSYATLWRYFADLDAHDHLSYEAALDEPLNHLLVDPRAASTTVVDNLWVRLVDVDRALTARRYATALDLVLDVEDDFCPWNTGRYRLRSDGADDVTCERTISAPDLRLSAATLASVHLGGPTLTTLAAAGRVEELRPGAVTAASRAFRGDREPFHLSGAAFPAF
ncbi:GNAT family N-acetyltransferase [Streptomyces sp. SID8379]|uniref:GNAT family N-acetyltransferase n=1 Tax=unclassified Streptomyces TaxID=2593676 RepID=UPI0003633682|nr:MULTISPECIES: GNAT family N-acetyltransferase [unclassified Streptomyces]MYW65587.1 GNAT family N-acetyltransferase [Streptomyces sp. SID8379]